MAKRLLPHVSKNNVRDVVRNCDICKSIDPAPITWSRGNLSVQSNWSRIAIDVTHFRSCCYLSLVDCGPSRYAVWRFLRNESAGEICGVFAQILCDFGPPGEIVADNGASFRSIEFLKLLKDWNINIHFGCAYRPQGNGIVERNHRTVKCMAARTNKAIHECVFFYNANPKSSDGISPAHSFFSRHFRFPFEKTCKEEIENASADFLVGDRVYVKPHPMSCASKWCTGVVSKVNPFNVEVDGIPRHISDIRLKDAVDAVSDQGLDERCNDVELDLDSEPDTVDVSPRPIRMRRCPRRFDDLVL